MKYVLILLFIITLFYIFLKYRQVTHEHYENSERSIKSYEDKLDYKIAYRLNSYQKDFDDIYDPEFVGLYSVAYHDFHDIHRDIDIINKHVNIPKDNSEIIVGGCGVGKMVHGLVEKGGYKQVMGIDFSKNMLKKARDTYPNYPYIRGNLVDPKILDPQCCTLFVLDERTLYMNDGKDMEKILFNIQNWLKDDGYIILPIYHKNNLQAACRYYSTNYIDNLGIVHSLTYLDQFRHDCWYIHNNFDKNESDSTQKTDLDEKTDSDSDENLTLYFDKFLTKKDQKKRIQTTMFNFVEPHIIYDHLQKNRFEKIHIEPICSQIVGGYELAIYQKKKNTASVGSIQKEHMGNNKKYKKNNNKK